MVSFPDQKIPLFKGVDKYTKWASRSTCLLSLKEEEKLIQAPDRECITFERLSSIGLTEKQLIASGKLILLSLLLGAGTDCVRVFAEGKPVDIAAEEGLKRFVDVFSLDSCDEAVEIHGIWKTKDGKKAKKVSGEF